VTSEEASVGWAYGAINACEQAGLVLFDPTTITAQEIVTTALQRHVSTAPGVCSCGYLSETWNATCAHKSAEVLEALRRG
jgi:hypothetical protein